MASMIVADDEATGTVACGRAAPTASTARPTASSTAGTRRRQRDRPGTAILTSAIEVTRTVARQREGDKRACQRQRLIGDGEPQVD
jgi:hypothetical protein